MKVGGALRVPGDKSISHRALMFAALGRGESRVRGLLTSADVKSTASVLRALGATIPEVSADEFTVRGGGLRGLRESSGDLDCGNSGTTARLMSGILAAIPFDSRVTGDPSLSKRPMKRVAKPLEAMGARFEFAAEDGLPLVVHGGLLRGVTWFSETASAQVKSAILLAGLVADVPVEVHEPAATRDHTERMLRARGVDVRTDGLAVTLLPAGRLDAVDTDVPGDPSSAAFFVALAAMSAGGSLAVEHVCVNPSRTGAFKVLADMGALIAYEDMHDDGGEPVANLVASSRTVRGVTIEPEMVPSLIDELPMLACVAARAAGETVVTGAAELRVKESDRISVVVQNLKAVGADAEELPDGFIVRGSDKPYRGAVRTHGDHRIAMAFGILGSLDGNAIEIDDRECVNVSYPAFWSDLARVIEKR
ncbi:MAG TPA: 3-phosphoshikimate 1-carboxyvinyltransferase [Gemmatimonadaceae bacterium]|jgi:3-phosphoshikimate 1-carboxyvinyltransferase|nr:3-phosphoshikimate 1-carboxyvinyltransferase [Gemmatimonadaceae bacterium]